MAKETKNKATEVETDAVSEMISKREKGTKFSYSVRKKVKMSVDAMRLKAGKEYDLHFTKAEFLVEKGWAEFIK